MPSHTTSLTCSACSDLGLQAAQQPFTHQAADAADLSESTCKQTCKFDSRMLTMFCPLLPCPPRSAPPPPSCAQCGATGTKLSVCKGCGQVRYCGTTCYKAGWPAHKLLRGQLWAKQQGKAAGQDAAQGSGSSSATGAGKGTSSSGATPAASGATSSAGTMQGAEAAGGSASGEASGVSQAVQAPEATGSMCAGQGCAACGATSVKLSTCSACGQAQYCGHVRWRASRHGLHVAAEPWAHQGWRVVCYGPKS